MSLWKYKEVMICIIETTSHGNYYSLVSTFPDISLLVKHLAKNEIFEQCLGRGIGTKILLCDIFRQDTTSISIEVALENYLNCARKNQQNINMQVSNTRNNYVNNTVERRGRRTILGIDNENKYY